MDHSNPWRIDLKGETSMEARTPKAFWTIRFTRVVVDVVPAAIRPLSSAATTGLVDSWWCKPFPSCDLSQLET